MDTRALETGDENTKKPQKKKERPSFFLEEVQVYIKSALVSVVQRRRELLLCFAECFSLRLLMFASGRGVTISALLLALLLRTLRGGTLPALDFFLLSSLAFNLADRNGCGDALFKLGEVGFVAESVSPVFSLLVVMLSPTWFFFLSFIPLGCSFRMASFKARSLSSV